MYAAERKAVILKPVHLAFKQMDGLMVALNKH